MKLLAEELLDSLFDLNWKGNQREEKVRRSTILTLLFKEAQAEASNTYWYSPIHLSHMHWKLEIALIYSIWRHLGAYKIDKIN